MAPILSSLWAGSKSISPYVFVGLALAYFSYSLGEKSCIAKIAEQEAALALDAKNKAEVSARDQMLLGSESAATHTQLKQDIEDAKEILKRVDGCSVSPGSIELLNSFVEASRNTEG